jgi:hypothetical protein
MLGFGVAVGAAGLSVAEAPLQLVLGLGAGSNAPAVVAQAPTSGASGGSGGGGGGGGGVETIYEHAPAVNPGSSEVSNGTSSSATTTTPGPLPPIKNVWVIVLDGQGYGQTLAGGSADTYLSSTLAHEGEVVSAYYGTAQSPLANEVAMLSGQGPTKSLLEDCPQYTAVKPAKTGKHGQVLGDGCVFPKSTPTLFSQLTAAHDTWKAYVQGMDSDDPPSVATTTDTTTAATPSAADGSAAVALAAEERSLIALRTQTVKTRTVAKTQTARARKQTSKSKSRAHLVVRRHIDTATTTACRHPSLGGSDSANSASAASGYVTWRNPAVYFQSVTGSNDCSSEDVGMSGLFMDLQSAESTPNVSFIYPDACNDGSDTPCISGAAAGTAQSDHFLQSVVPAIMNSPAYKAGGMIVITSDEAPQSGQYASSASCCDTPAYPNIPNGWTVPTTTQAGTGATSQAGTSSTETDTTTTDTGTCTTTTTTGTTTSSTETSATGTGTGTTDTTSSSADTTAPSTSASCTSPPSTSTPSASTPGTSTPSTSTPSTATATDTLCLAGEDPLGNPCTGGGGQVGALVLTKWVKPGSSDTTDQFNHFSLLLTIEKLFGLSPIGYAAESQTAYFQGSLFFQKYTPGS